MSCSANPFRVFSCRISVSTALRKNTSLPFIRMASALNGECKGIRDTVICWGEVFVQGPVEYVGDVWAQRMSCARVNRLLGHLPIGHVSALYTRQVTTLFFRILNCLVNFEREEKKKEGGIKRGIRGIKLKMCSYRKLINFRVPTVALTLCLEPRHTPPNRWLFC